MRPCTLVLILGLLCGPLANAQRSVTHPNTLRVFVSELGPTQQGVGKAIVHSIVAHELRKKPAWLTERAYLCGPVRSRYAKRTFEAIRDPAGRLRILDGHHRASAAAELSHRAGVPYAVRVHLVQDYRGWRQLDYARHLLLTLKKGSFSRATEARFPLAGRDVDANVIARVNRFPRRIDDCSDDPMRSIVGTLLFHVRGFDDEAFVDYFEFKLGRRIDVLPSGRPRWSRRFLNGINSAGTRARVLRVVGKQLFTPLTIAYLRVLIRPGHDAAARRSLAILSRRVQDSNRGAPKVPASRRPIRML